MKGKEVILIKLGGSAITYKSLRKKPNLSTISYLCDEIKSFISNEKTPVIISHGQGSYAHYPAKRYGIKNGLNQRDSQYGLGLTRLECIELNKILLEHLLKRKIAATTIQPFSIMTSRNGKLQNVFLETIINCLDEEIIPILHGDVISDSKKGCTIFSGETVLNIIAIHLKKYKPRLIIEVAQTKGVYDNTGATIPKINKDNYKEALKSVKDTDSVDVTGGMLHKIQEAYQLAREIDIPTVIISSEKGNLQKALEGNFQMGTLIS